ncbi:uncharacterized protein PAN0_002c1426 [Moesziomyces antarcticus]|uniref:Uncharacterized protein n=1 Tax=Pseudozyma antarctica TaxID=84753 RepID=A0A5C3FIF1_PSEA2|nr:uncharacterized protein PAN0_002c1426 [Moesziomyces antarcticus]GAK63222.1 hypothetical protein PAN0_002c1426 [Moesziomyces antarcticus]SPO43291.1 uncharacterized protein PSANT_00975 [Moesziomyces antarcticus]
MQSARASSKVARSSLLRSRSSRCKNEIIEALLLRTSSEEAANEGTANACFSLGSADTGSGCVVSGSEGRGSAADLAISRDLSGRGHLLRDLAALVWKGNLAK